MNRVIGLQTQLLETQAAIARLTQSILDNPTSKSLQLMAESLQKRHRSLEEEFLSETEAVGVTDTRTVEQVVLGLAEGMKPSGS